MNCIIIDDKRNCKLLEDYVAKFTSLNFVGSFSDSVSAKNQLLKCQDIDLVFLNFEILSMSLISSIVSIKNIILS